jgi:hypothetical protein
MGWEIYIFLILALVGGEWLALRAGRFTPVERASSTRSTGCSVGPRAGLDDVENRKFLTLPGLNSDPSVVQPVGAVQTE